MNRNSSRLRLTIVGLVGLVLLGTFGYISYNGQAIIGVTMQSYVAEVDNGIGLEPYSSEVRVRGVKVGEVTSVDWSGEHALVNFRVDPALDLRADTKLLVHLQNLVGEKYIDLVPGTSPEPLGRRIPLEATSVTGGVGEMMANARAPLEMFTPEQLGATRDYFGALVGTYAPRTRSVLTRAGALADNLGTGSESFLDVIDDVDVLLAALADNSGAFSAIAADLRRTGTAVGDVADEQTAAALGIFTDLVLFRALLDRRAAELRLTMERVPVELRLTRALVNKLAANLATGEYPVPIGIDNFGPALMRDYDAASKEESP